MKEDRLRTIRSNEFGKEINEKYIVSALVIEEVLGNSLVELLEEIRVVLEDFLDIFSRELPNSLSSMLNIYITS